MVFQMWFTLCSGISESVYENDRTVLSCKVRLPNPPSTGALFNTPLFLVTHSDMKDHQIAAFFAKFSVHTSHQRGKSCFNLQTSPSYFLLEIFAPREFKKMRQEKKSVKFCKQNLPVTIHSWLLWIILKANSQEVNNQEVNNQSN